MLFVLQVIHWAFTAYESMIMIWALMTWFPQAQGSTLARWLDRLVYPYIEVFERFIPRFGGVSFAALVGAGVLYYAEQFIITQLGRLMGVF